MGCPHIDNGSVSDFGHCGMCGQPFCDACLARHVCVDDDGPPVSVHVAEAPPSAYGSLTAAERGDDEVVLTEEERAELDAYIRSLEQAASDEVPVTNAHLAEATLLSLTSTDVDSELPPPPPVVTLPQQQSAPVQTVAMNGVTTLAKPALPPREYPFRCMLWNVANLGGKFGYPKTRDASVIDATAHIIHAADADVVVILELLGTGTGEKRPKPPVKPPERGAREASNPLQTRLLESFAAGAKAEALLTVMGRYFAERVQAAIWPGAAPDIDALRAEAKAFQDEDSGATLDTLMDASWGSVCAPLLAGLAPAAADTGGDGEAPEPVNVDALASNVTSGAKKRNRGRRAADDGKQDELLLKAEAHVLRDGIQLLVAEGYTHWLESHSKNYAKNDGSEGVSKKDGDARDEACKKVLSVLSAGCQSLWVLFLRDVVGSEVTDEMLEQWDAVEGRRSQYESKVWLGCWNLLVRANEKAMTADYERRVARWEKRHGKGDGKATKHDGIREFLRIRDALNVLAGDAYASWPAAVPADEDKSLYRQGETYGVLWKKASVAPELGQVQFVPDFASDFKFEKRPPLRFPVKLSKAASGPAIALVPWHAPAPSKQNATARSKDFPSFVRYCEAERKAKRLGMLLSDLNVNTVSGSTTVEHCDGELQVGALFQGISGRAAHGAFPAQVGTQSTLAVSKFRPWLVPDLLDKEDASAKTARELVDKLQAKFVKGHFSTSQGLLEFIQGFSKDFTPQHRMGASAYDKILPICGREDRWRLGYKSSWAVPFPHALALLEEAEFFRSEEQLPPRLRKFAFLLAKNAKKTLEDLRAYAEQPSKAAKLEDLMQVGRELSDHLPVIAEWVLVDTESVADEAEVVEAPIELFSTKPSAPGVPEELEKRAATYEGAAVLAEREKALEALVGWWNETYDKASPPAEAQRRFERALHKWDAIQEARAKQNDDDSRQASRPALTKKEEPRKKEATKTLPVHLHSLALGTRDNAGGGDCLFRSIAQLVFGDENRHDEVRQASVNHLEDLLAGISLDAHNQVGDVSREEFATRLGQLHDWHRVQWPNALAYRRMPGVDRWRQFCVGMSRGGEWGDLIILCAASHLFGVRFRVYVQVAGGFYSDEVDFVNRALGARPELVLVNYGNYHFVAVVPNNRVALMEPGVGTPAGWEGLRARRDRAPPPPPQQQAQPSGGTKEPAKESASGSGAVVNAPKPTGNVFRWPDTSFWVLGDAVNSPRSLFLFGENAAKKGSGEYQDSTQACIRPASNALGIRTCWKPGASEGDGGAMLDADLAKNTKAIDEDFDECRWRLLSGRFTTLVVPWDSKNNRPALGVGVAQLPQRAKLTYAHLCQRLDALMKWAEANLSMVLVCPRETGLAEDICKAEPQTLFVHEVATGLDFPDALKWVPDKLLKLPNVLPVRTGNSFFAILDSKLAQNQLLLGQDFDALEKAVASGAFRRIVIPSGGKALGMDANLQSAAPNTWAYVQQRLKQLVDLCARTAAPAIAPEPVVVALPGAFAGKPGGKAPAKESSPPVEVASEDSDERSRKVLRRAKTDDVSGSPREEEAPPPPKEQPPGGVKRKKPGEE